MADPATHFGVSAIAKADCCFQNDQHLANEVVLAGGHVAQHTFTFRSIVAGDRWHTAGQDGGDPSGYPQGDGKTEAQWKDADSLMLLREVGRLIEEAGYRIANIDATVALQRPKLRPHIDAMRHNIAETLSLDVGQVSVKATTTERLGFVGAEAGAAASAVCLLTQK